MNHPYGRWRAGQGMSRIPGLAEPGAGGTSWRVPETQEAPRRRWSGYVCPDCRFVFRIPRDHAGRGLVCPNCRRVLRIPGPGDAHAPLVVPLPESGPDAAKPKGVKRRRRKSRKGVDQEWDRTTGGSRSASHDEKRQMRGMLVAGSLLLALILAGVLFAILRDKPQAAKLPGSQPAPSVIQPAAPGEPVLGDGEFLAAAEPLAKSFLAATRIEELLPLIREPQRAEPRIRAWFPDGRIDAAGLNAFDVRRMIERNGPLLSVQVRTNDFTEKTMTFAPSPAGLKIDWEAWAGWSEMPWAGFLSTKPATPVLFRAMIAQVDYYNFAFSDDRKWRSYRLESPDGEHSLYAYVERGSLLDSRIHLSPDVKRSPLTLRIAFPDGAASRGNQVLVRELLTEGWALENETPP